MNMFIILLYILFFLLVFGVSFLIFFLRNPARIPPPGNVILSPADGKVVEVAEEEGWAKIVVFMNLLNVHVQWVPYPGKVIAIEKIDGPAKPGYMTEASKNKQVVATLETSLGKMVVKQIVGILVRRIETFIKAGDQIEVGQRFGRIIFGSRVELWLPKDKVEVLVQKEQKVLAGRTIAARPR